MWLERYPFEDYTGDLEVQMYAGGVRGASKLQSCPIGISRLVFPRKRRVTTDESRALAEGGTNWSDLTAITIDVGHLLWRSGYHSPAVLTHPVVYSLPREGEKHDLEYSEYKMFPTHTEITGYTLADAKEVAQEIRSEKGWAEESVHFYDLTYPRCILIITDGSETLDDFDESAESFGLLGGQFSVIWSDDSQYCYMECRFEDARVRRRLKEDPESILSEVFEAAFSMLSLRRSETEAKVLSECVRTAESSRLDIMTGWHLNANNTPAALAQLRGLKDEIDYLTNSIWTIREERPSQQSHAPAGVTQVVKLQLAAKGAAETFLKSLPASLDIVNLGVVYLERILRNPTLSYPVLVGGTSVPLVFKLENTAPATFPIDIGANGVLNRGLVRTGQNEFQLFSKIPEEQSVTLGITLKLRDQTKTYRTGLILTSSPIGMSDIKDVLTNAATVGSIAVTVVLSIVSLWSPTTVSPVGNITAIAAGLGGIVTLVIMAANLLHRFRKKGKAHGDTIVLSP